MTRFLLFSEVNIFFRFLASLENPVIADLMHKIYLLFFLASGWTHAMFTPKVSIDHAGALACWTWASKFDFGCPKEEILVPCRCNNDAFLGTVLMCISSELGKDRRDSAYGYIRQICKSNGCRTMAMDDFDEIIDASEKLPQLPIPNSSTRYTVPVAVNKTEFKCFLNVAQEAKKQYVWGSIFGWSMLLYWLIVVMAAAAKNYLMHFDYRVVLRVTKPWLNRFRRLLSLPAMFSRHHADPLTFKKYFKIYTPTRGQSIIVFFYICLGILFLCFGYTIYTPNPLLGSKRNQVLRYLSNRTAVISATQLPLLVLFAARNSPLIKLTGWPYTSFQLYHRWIARVVVLNALIHSITYTWIAIEQRSAILRWHEIINWRFGNIALYACIISILFSLHWIRSMFYEVFLVAHQVSWMVFIVGMFGHCQGFGWTPWILAAVCLWMTERALRILRIVVAGGRCRATCTMFDKECIRISIKYSEAWDISPGSFVFLRILKKDMYWQEHPFTIFESPLISEKGCIQIAVRPKNGLTKRLANFLELQVDQRAELTVLVDGPYGASEPVFECDTCIFLSGGIGITATFPYASRIKSNNSSKQKVYFIWLVQNISALDWFGEEINSLYQCDNVDVELYITRSLETFQELSDIYPGGSPSVNTGNRLMSEDAENIDTESNQISMPGVTSALGNPSSALDEVSHISRSERFLNQYGFCVHSARPNLSEEVAKVVDTARGSVCISTCGPPEFVDSVRFSITKNMKDSAGRVEYFEEAFTW